MARIIIDIPDSYVDWARWAQDELAKGGLPNTQTALDPAPTQSPAREPDGTPSNSTGGQDAPPTNDPWAAVSSAGTQAAAPSVRAAAPASTAGPNRITKQTKNGDLVFELNLNNAPECNCGDAAARLTAPKRAGGTYTKWVCAKDSGSDWKQKCDFSEWGS